MRCTDDQRWAGSLVSHGNRPDCLVPAGSAKALETDCQSVCRTRVGRFAAVVCCPGAGVRSPFRADRTALGSKQKILVPRLRDERQGSKSDSPSWSAFGPRDDAKQGETTLDSARWEPLVCMGYRPIGRVCLKRRIGLGDWGRRFKSGRPDQTTPLPRQGCRRSRPILDVSQFGLGVHFGVHFDTYTIRFCSVPCSTVLSQKRRHNSACGELEMTTEDLRSKILGTWHPDVLRVSFLGKSYWIPLPGRT